MIVVSKNVSGAAGCSSGAVTSLNLVTSKYEAIKRKQAESSNNEKNQDGSTKKADSSGSSGSASNSKSASANSGASTDANIAKTKPAEDKAAEACVVTYMSGSSEYTRQEVEKGKDVKYSIGELPDDPDDDRAEFRGWWIEKETGKKKTKFTSSTRVKEDITVYAKWIRVICHYVDDQLIDRREVEIEAPDSKVHASFNFKSERNGDIDGWQLEQEGK